MKLSICIITMNRANSLKKAIESCLRCDLPDETEFIIVDNASTDDTDIVVSEIFSGCTKQVVYEKLPYNIGAGNGRNYAFSKAKGQYVYSLDDDAYIPEEYSKSFFLKALDIMDNNEDIISLTTQIYDNAWGRDRITDRKNRIGDNLYKSFYICEGSNFLRRVFFDDAPYFPNDYGYESVPIVLEIFDSGKENCFYDGVCAIHDPLVNKWDYSKAENHDLLIKEVSLLFAIKKMLYPKVFAHILTLAFWARSRKYMKKIPDAKEKAKRIISDTTKNYRMKNRIRVSTVIKMFKTFGMTTF